MTQNSSAIYFAVKLSIYTIHSKIEDLDQTSEIELVYSVMHHY